jgi:uncharacterized phage infection (PIP) family protein YhgE
MTRFVFNQTFACDYTFSKPKAAPPYTGTLLPAVIHTFDFQVDIEEAETIKLTLLTQSLEQSIATITAQGNGACSGLEPERPELIKELKVLNTKLRTLHAKLLDLDADLTLEAPDAEEQPQAQISEEAKAKVKAATQEVKNLHRKIMSLTHEERYGKNPVLRELFDMANVARENNDVEALADLLSAAKKYHQSASDRRQVLEFLKQKRKALLEKVKSMQAKVNEVKASAPYAVHILLERKQKEHALTLFTSILNHAKENLTVQIQVAANMLKERRAHQRKQKSPCKPL